MRYLLTSLFCVFTLSLTAQVDCQGPDFNSDGVIGAADLIVFLTYYGYEWPLVPEFVCGETIAHQDYAYSTVEIGDQCWFAENCRYLPIISTPFEVSSTSPYYYVYDFLGTDLETAKATENYETYGVLYNWPAVMAEGICPSGWHIPSDGEWQTMEISLGMTEAEAASEGPRGSPVGNYLKSSTGWDSTKTWSGNGSDSVGFTGLPAGFASTGGFTYTEIIAVWWSATEVDSGQESYWKRILWDSSDAVVREGNWVGDGFSARCVRD
jgi:uncharacterized protein (TIGR02145 family)